MPPISDATRIFILVIVVIATILTGVLLSYLEKNISYLFNKLFRRGGGKPSDKPSIFWILLVLMIMIAAGGTAVASVAPKALPKIPDNSLPIPFHTPTINTVIKNFGIGGYSKQTALVKNSKGELILFIRNERELGFINSNDRGETWSKPNIFDVFSSPGGPAESAAIDSADRIHVVWGKAPDASNLNYGLLENLQWTKKEVISAGTYAWDIDVDSANHPHIVWSNIDVFYIANHGKQWYDPHTVMSGSWAPDIQLNNVDDVFVFTNIGNFYPAPDVNVYSIDNTDGHWNPPQRISKGPFWSGGAAAAIDGNGIVYLVWIASTTEGGGADQIFFSMYMNNEWLNPIFIGNLRTSAGSTGGESPAIALDGNNTLYVFWRGLNEKSRPVIFARAFITPSTKLTDIGAGWSEPIIIDDRNASDVWWPSVADEFIRNRSAGVYVVWDAIIGTEKVIDFTQIIYP